MYQKSLIILSYTVLTLNPSSYCAVKYLLPLTLSLNFGIFITDNANAIIANINNIKLT